MTREKAISLVKGWRKDGKTYTEISKLLPDSWVGSREPGTIQRWMKKPPSDLPKYIKPVVKRQVLKRQTTIVVPSQPETAGKVLIMMCSIEQAKELLK
jgi:hypothetical protein